MKQVLTLLAAKYDTPNGIPKVDANNATANNIVGGVLLIIGAICIVFIIIGAIQYIISMGDSSKIKKAKDSILYAVVGLIVSGIAFFIVQFVVGLFK